MDDIEFFFGLKVVIQKQISSMFLYFVTLYKEMFESIFYNIMQTSLKIFIKSVRNIFNLLLYLQVMHRQIVICSFESDYHTEKYLKLYNCCWSLIISCDFINGHCITMAKSICTLLYFKITSTTYLPDYFIHNIFLKRIIT